MQQALRLNYLHTVSDIFCRRDKVQSGLLHALERNSFWNGDLITPTVEREEAKLHHHPKLDTENARLYVVEISRHHVVPLLQCTKDLERGTFQTGLTISTQIGHPILEIGITQRLRPESLRFCHLQQPRPNKPAIGLAGHFDQNMYEIIHLYLQQFKN